MRTLRRAGTLAVTLLVSGLAIAGCSDRPRTNPLDPNNPSTGGGPTGFFAHAGNEQVALGWDAAPAGALTGFRLERRAGSDAAWDNLVDLPLGTLRHIDETAAQDVEYEYRLSLLGRDGLPVGARPVAAARPGPELVWIADAEANAIVRLSPDGRARVLTIPGVQVVNHIAVDVGSGNVWATQPSDGRVRVFAPDGGVRGSFAAYTGSGALAFDPLSGTAWICDDASGVVGRYRIDGVRVAETGVFASTRDVAVTAGSGAWICDPARGWLVRFDANGATQDTVVLGGDPRSLAIDPLDGSVWVTVPGRNEVVRVAADGAIAARHGGLEFPYAIDIDEFRNRVWVSLRLRGEVVSLDRATGAVVSRTGGIPVGVGVAVADRTGEVFVTSLEAGEVVRLSPTGAVLGRLGGFTFPLEIVVDPGPRAALPPAALRGGS